MLLDELWSIEDAQAATGDRVIWINGYLNTEKGWDDHWQTVFKFTPTDGFRWVAGNGGYWVQPSDYPYPSSCVVTDWPNEERE